MNQTLSNCHSAKFVLAITMFAFAVVRIPVRLTREQSEVLCTLATACWSRDYFAGVKGEFSTAVKKAGDEAGLPQCHPTDNNGNTAWVVAT